ncbi:MAG: hypothetical protein IJR48_02455, partial [Oscillibacter sp.]|nr:hypothetical protein [Oscillibacter sp.]
MKKTKTKRYLWILAVFLLLLFLLCFWLYRRNASRPGERDVVPATRAEVVLAFLPSASADDSTVNVMSAAARQLFGEFQAAESKVSVLYWRSGVPPEGLSCTVSAVSSESDLQTALSSAECGGSLSTAFQYAKGLSGEGESLSRKVVLLTDRAPLDGEQAEEGPYDAHDTAAYQYANAASQSAAELSIRDDL